MSFPNLATIAKQNVPRERDTRQYPALFIALIRYRKAQWRLTLLLYCPTKVCQATTLTAVGILS